MKKNYVIMALILIIVAVGVFVFLNNKGENNMVNSQNTTNIVENNTNIDIQDPTDEISTNMIATPTED